jgi:hypothetical protein
MCLITMAAFDSLAQAFGEDGFDLAHLRFPGRNTRFGARKLVAKYSSSPSGSPPVPIDLAREPRYPS